MYIFCEIYVISFESIFLAILHVEVTRIHIFPQIYILLFASLFSRYLTCQSDTKEMHMFL